MIWTPKRRYSAVAVFSDDLERIVLIHKLKPDWQARKANVPGGKVDDSDYEHKQGCRFMFPNLACCLSDGEAQNGVHRRCAARELAEETGLVADAAALTHFCTLRFRSREGDDAECRFYCTRGNVETARTTEKERVFVHEVAGVVADGVAFHETYRSGDRAKQSDVQTAECPFLGEAVCLPTMPNLPWLVAMARQVLSGQGPRGGYVVEEVLS